MQKDNTIILGIGILLVLTFFLLPNLGLFSVSQPISYECIDDSISSIKHCELAFDDSKTTYSIAKFALVGFQELSSISNYPVIDPSGKITILNKIYLGSPSTARGQIGIDYSLEIYSFDKQEWVNLNSIKVEMGQGNPGVGKEFNVRGQIDYNEEFLSNNEILIRHNFDLEGTLQNQGVEIRDYFQEVSFENSIGSLCGDGICDTDEICLSDCNTQTPECNSKYERKCYDGDAYWYDSCGVREDKIMDCLNGCLSGRCIGTAHICGDGSCQPSESPTTCPEDCQSGGSYCGNGICEEGENSINCDVDCKKVSDCNQGDENCIGTFYYTCSNGNWVSQGEVEGKCGYTINGNGNGNGEWYDQDIFGIKLWVVLIIGGLFLLLIGGKRKK